MTQRYTPHMLENWLSLPEIIWIDSTTHTVYPSRQGRCRTKYRYRGGRHPDHKLSRERRGRPFERECYAHVFSALSVVTTPDQSCEPRIITSWNFNRLRCPGLVDGIRHSGTVFRPSTRHS
ncbi:hypothetical protein CONPUDRAFT_134567 [Coniophora puteana RWD-64-598 SS2]|uniref:Uncharacterized protein n=1 Tax=Coniophora puteana (strain RWD-64-598) TaxID=741705 RepID=A0A5M3N7Y4_CONPW|nr:uncharacterized protein CONPUDRAFT_134567 [Coniophora puteana RWD-64-598 SS2]EIW87408.1 hypothetical protein CONPUDRAFT_134567 [Coniophora puteana RWD-64-598 SS2]